MADFKRIIQRTTNSERVETGVADLQPNEICIVEDGEELIYKDRQGKFISVSKDKYKIDTIEDLKNSKKYKIGDIVEVLGYYTRGDGAGHPRKANDIDDGSGVQGKNGIWWNVVHNGKVNVSWFGAKGDGISNDILPIQKSINTSNIVKFDGKTYKCEGCLDIKPKLSLIGVFEKTKINIVNDTDFIYHTDTIYQVLFEKISFVKVSGNGSCIKIFDNDIQAGTHFPQVVEIRDCSFEGFIGNTIYKNMEINLAPAVYYYGGLECSFHNCSFSNNNIGIYLHEQQQPRVSLCNFSRSRLADIFIQSGHNASIQENDFVSIDTTNRVISWKVPGTNYTVDGSHLIIFGAVSPNILGNKIKQEYCISSLFNTNINIDKNYIIFNNFCIISKNDNNINITNNYMSSYNNAIGGYIDLSYPTSSNLKNNTFEYSSGSTYDFLIKISNRYSNINIEKNLFGTKTSTRNVLVKTVIEQGVISRGILNLSYNSFVGGGNTIIERVYLGSNEIGGSLFVGNSFYTTETSEIRDRSFPLFQSCLIIDENGVSFSKNKFGSAYIKSVTSYTINLSSDIILSSGGTQFLTTSVSGGITSEDTSCTANMNYPQSNISITANVYATNRITVTLKNNHTSGITIPQGTKIHIFALSYHNDTIATSMCELNIKNNAIQLDTPYYSMKMQEEGIYELYINYMDRKIEYDRLQKEIKEQKKLAFEQRENKEQNYEEWLAEQPKILLEEKPPQPDEKILEFANKYGY